MGAPGKAGNFLSVKVRHSQRLATDIKGFFDNVEHDWLMRCVEQRISDESLLRLLKRFLKAGIIEEGKYLSSEKGTPQGGLCKA